MPPRTSAGILLFRPRNGQLEVLLAHPGGPFFANKDAGHWTIPKGEADGDEAPVLQKKGPPLLADPEGGARGRGGARRRPPPGVRGGDRSSAARRPAGR